MFSKMLVYHKVPIFQNDLEHFYANDTYEILNRKETESLPYYNRYSDLIDTIKNENKIYFSRFIEEFKCLLFLNQGTEKTIRAHFPTIECPTKSVLVFFNKPNDVPKYKVDFFVFLVFHLNLLNDFEIKYYLCLRDSTVKKVFLNDTCEEKRQRMSQCLEYIKNLKNNEIIIKYFPNSLRLNMKRGPYNETKSNIAFAKGELTLLPGISMKKKDELEKNNIFSFRQKDFLTKVKPFLHNRYLEKIENILRLFDNNQRTYVSSKIVEDPQFLKVLQSEYGYVFFDFEYTSTVIYMVGLYVISFQTGISYFIPLLHANVNNDFALLYEFEKYFKLFENYIWIYYSMEKGKATTWFESNHKKIDTSNWVDLCSLLQNHCAFYGCFNYKLKTIVNFLIHEGIIDSTYDDDCSSGSSSLLLYDEYCRENDFTILEKIKKYNEKDCRYMKDILFYVLKNFK